MTRIYLVRHAVHDLVGKVLVGRGAGVSLSPEGFRQAALLRDHFAAAPVGRILSSPVQRAAETAALVAEPHGGAVETAENVTEIDCGDWTGASFEALADDPRWHVWNTERDNAGMPGGETMLAVQRRASGVLDALCGEPQPVLLVSHADVIKAMVAGLIGMPLRLHDRIVIDPASITTIDMWSPGAGKVVRMNEAVAP